MKILTKNGWNIKMTFKFWKKPECTPKSETVIEVKAYDGGVEGIYVRAQSPEKALELFQKLKDNCKKWKNE